MRVAERRWGEVSVKKQGQRKNKFDETRSFSVVQTGIPWEVSELKAVLELTVNLTEAYDPKELKRRLTCLMKQNKEE